MIETARDILKKENCTCVLTNGKVVYKSDERGIMTMMNFIRRGVDLKGFSAADKIVGKAAAMLFVIAGVKEVYAGVLSKNAKDVLEKYKISVSYDILTLRIENRLRNGICPIEMMVENIDYPQEAYFALKKRIFELARMGY